MIKFNDKIAIIGAGPSGMAAAEALREKGVTNVTIFEKKSNVGGMSLSKVYKCEDGREIVYDLGSIQPFGSKKLFSLIKESGLHLGKEFYPQKYHPIRVYSAKEKKFVADFKDHLLGVPIAQLPALFADVVKMGKILYKFRRLSKPGFNKLADVSDVAVPIPAWISKQEFNYLDRILNMFFALSLNAGVNLTNTDIPIILGLKGFINDALGLPPKYIMGKFAPIREGYQALWLKVAKKHKVILNSDITEIVRGSEGITITANNENYKFDKLIIAHPPINLSKVVNFSPEEDYVFQKIKFSPAWRGAFVASNLPSDAIYIFLDEMENKDTPPIIAGLIPEGKVGENKWLYSTMIGSHHVKDINQVMSDTKALFANIIDLKNVDIEWIDSSYWPQFGGYFSAQDVHDGIYDAFEKLQGENNTFYTGELLSGNSHGIVLDYSYDLIKRFLEY